MALASRKTKTRALAALSALASCAAGADTPLGWIDSAIPSAYTTNARQFEIELGALAVNDTIDFLNYREDLISNDRRLVGDSGDLSGNSLAIHYGILDSLSVYYSRQSHDLTVDLGTINSANVIDIDKSLNTLQESIGAKWTFYRGDLLNPDNRTSAATIEVSASAGKSDDFELVIDEFRLQNVNVFFINPQTFSVADLEDTSWKARLLYTWPMEDFAIATIWAGYGESEASSGTTSDLTSQTFRRFFEQSFEVEESYLYFGASLNLQITPRIPLNMSYEFVSINDSEFARFPETPTAGLPGFLSAASQGEEDRNHTFKARVSYWLTPDLNLSLSGNLYSNQFLGVIPHYNNPLSGTFSSLPYGFASVQLGYKF